MFISTLVLSPVLLSSLIDVLQRCWLRSWSFSGTRKRVFSIPGTISTSAGLVARCDADTSNGDGGGVSNSPATGASGVTILKDGIHNRVTAGVSSQYLLPKRRIRIAAVVRYNCFFPRYKIRYVDRLAF